MIEHWAFRVEPWCLREVELDLDVLAQSESVFALSNGHIGWRANLDEGDPHGLPGSYLNGVHELRPLPYAEAGYGYPERDQVIVNVTNGKLIRLLVDDEPFDVRYGTLEHHERVLDFRDGELRRDVRWTAPSHKTIEIHSTRLVSLVQRSVAAIQYEVRATDQTVRVVIQSELNANEPLPSSDGDPRSSAIIAGPWHAEFHDSEGARSELVHRTEFSQLTMAAAMDHEVDGPPGTQVSAESGDDLGRVTISTTLQPGEALRFVKFVTYGWSSERSSAALRDQVDAALVAARQCGWDGLRGEQRAYLDEFWGRADVLVDGDAAIQQAVRFALFHVLQSAVRAERRGVPAKGLTGTGYDGHTFWDTESFLMPVLTYTAPETVADLLAWRHGTLPTAKARAEQLGLHGAAFPWRTITGVECSAYWPAGTAAFHVNADIAQAVTRYVEASGDGDFEESMGLEILVETARLWRALGHFDNRGQFRIDGVTGPDEYSAVADNNVYTNLMAQDNLRAAAAASLRHLEVARRLGVDEEELASWRVAADAMTVPFDDVLGVHAQAEGFTSHQFWDFVDTGSDKYPLLLHFPYFDLYRKQVVKQADLVLAMYVRGDAFTPEQKAANFDYYERLTVRDSSLSACIQSIMAAEVGHVELAYDYLGEAALMDLDDLEHNTRDGLHGASLAGSWLALVAGLGGMRVRDEALSFAPRLPEGLTRLRFGLEFRGRRLRVDTTAAGTSYELVAGDDLSVAHFDEPCLVRVGESVVRDTPPLGAEVSERARPTQPAGREPERRGEASSRPNEETT